MLISFLGRGQCLRVAEFAVKIFKVKIFDKQISHFIMEWTGFTDEDLRRLKKSSSSSGKLFLSLVSRYLNAPICVWHCLGAVFFNQGSAEPKGSASVCQGFRSWPVTNNLACKITPDNIVEILSVDFFCLKLRFYVSFCIDSLCWIIFVVSKILTYLHFRLKPIS